MISQRIVIGVPVSGAGVSDSALRVLITGGNNVGKTSLAFALAYENAENGGTPLFICNATKLEAKLPLYVSTSSSGDAGGVRMAPEVLSRISMKYVASMNELKAMLAGLHAFAPPPSLVLIDDFTLLVDPLHSVQRSDPKFLEICITLGAFLDDVETYLTAQGAPRLTAGGGSNVGGNRSAGSRQLRVVVTDSCEEPAYLSVMHRVIPALLSMRKTGEGADDAVSMVLLPGPYSRQNTVPILPRIELHQGALVAQL
jgi:hypothetical protein